MMTLFQYLQALLRGKTGSRLYFINIRQYHQTKTKRKSHRKRKVEFIQFYRMVCLKYQKKMSIKNICLIISP